MSEVKPVPKTDSEKKKPSAFRRVFWLLVLMLFVGGAGGWLFAQDMLNQSALKDLMIWSRPKKDEPKKPAGGKKPARNGAHDKKPGKQAPHGTKPHAAGGKHAAKPQASPSPQVAQGSPAPGHGAPAAQGEKPEPPPRKKPPRPKTREEIEEERDQDPREAMYGLSQLKGPHEDKLRAQLCATNLQTLSVALRSYASDHEHQFPKKLSQLSPKYLKYLLKCPSAKKDTYTSAYEVDVEAELYTVSCGGANHKVIGLPAGFPRLTRAEGIQIR